MPDIPALPSQSAPVAFTEGPLEQPAIADAPMLDLDVLPGMAPRLKKSTPKEPGSGVPFIVLVGSQWCGLRCEATCCAANAVSEATFLFCKGKGLPGASVCRQQYHIVFKLQQCLGDTQGCCRNHFILVKHSLI